MHTCAEEEAVWYQHRCVPARTAGTCDTCAGARTEAAQRALGLALPLEHCIVLKRVLH